MPRIRSNLRKNSSGIRARPRRKTVVIIHARSPREGNIKRKESNDGREGEDGNTLHDKDVHDQQ